MKASANSFINVLSKVFAAIGVVAVIGIIFFVVSGKSEKAYHTQTMEQNTKNPVEMDHEIQVTVSDVERRMNDVAKLITEEESYSGSAKVIDKKENWGIAKNLTKHEIDITYCGKISCGYDLNDIDIMVDNENKEIVITLGDPIFDNNVPEENIRSTDKNNLLNTIRSDEVTNRIAEIKEQEMEKAISKGIVNKAKSSATKTIKETLYDFDEYRVTVL